MNTIPKSGDHYASDPNIVISTDKQKPSRKWVNPRHHHKRIAMESDSDSSGAQEVRRTKTACCPTNTLNETINAFREEMKAMHCLLTTMKDDQDSRFERIQTDISEIKTEMAEMKNNVKEAEKTVNNLKLNYEELDKSQKYFSDCIKKQDNKIKDIFQNKIYLEKCNKALEERIMILEQKELNRNIELVH